MTPREPSANCSVITAQSMSPIAARLGSTSAAPMALTSTTSLAIMNRARSKSWIVMSAKRPPDVLMYSAGWGAGSRDVILISDGVAGEPLAQRREVAVGAAVEPQLHGDAGLPDRRQRLADTTEVQVDRLLAEDVLPLLGGRDDLIAVRGRRRADQDRVDVV